MDATADDYWDIRSVTKTVMSTLIGSALDQGHLAGVDQILADNAEAQLGALAP